MQKKTRIALAAGTIALVGAAGFTTFATAEYRHRGGHHMAGHHGHKIARVLQRFDTDENGALTQKEFDDARAKLFADHDANSDSKLTLKEFETLWLDVMRQRMVRGFQRLDKDGDGEISNKEYTKPFSNLVERMDRNEDGVLDYKDRRHHKRHKGRHGHDMHHKDDDSHHRGSGHGKRG